MSESPAVTSGSVANHQLWITTASPEQIRIAVQSYGGYGNILGSDLQQAASFTKPAAAEAFLASRALLKLLVSQAIYASPARAADIVITRYCRQHGWGSHGQPRTEGYSVSLSRTSTLVAAALAPTGVAVGIDLEDQGILGPTAVGANVDQLAFNAAERQLLSSHPLPDKVRLALWTGKEAVLKATGDGLRIEPSRLDLSSVIPIFEHHRSAWVPVKTPGLSPATLQLRWYEPGTHLLALAASSPLPVHHVDFNLLNQA